MHFLKKNHKSILVSLLLLLAAISLFGCKKETEEESLASSESETETVQQNPCPDLTRYGLEVQFIGNVAGTYLEDGSDEPLSSVFAIKLKNITEKALQYGEIHVTSEGETYDFTLSTLPSGASLVCEEKNRKEYRGNGEDLTAVMENVAWFPAGLMLYEDIFEITVGDRSITVKNKSENPVKGDVSVYYKYFDGEKYLGGITYRATFPNGIAAGAEETQFASHMSQTGSRVLFVTFAP